MYTIQICVLFSYFLTIIATGKISSEVEFSPVVTVSQSRVYQALGHPSTLQCRVMAYPSPALYWYKDDLLLSNNIHFSLSNFGIDNSIITILRILKVGANDFGTYTCNATNKLGSSSGSVQLLESAVPISAGLGNVIDSIIR